MSNTQVVPFGKYKGRQVEEMVADRQYCDWLQAQPWFGERFPQMRVLIMNVGQEPQDTPEHNEMQARFLDPQYCVRLWSALQSVPAEVKEARESARGAAKVNVETCERAVERRRKDLQSSEESLERAKADKFRVHRASEFEGYVEHSRKELAAVEGKLQEAIAFLEQIDDWLASWPSPVIHGLAFEVKGWDVIFGVRYAPKERPFDLNIFGVRTNVFVECKPVIGDDYPAVLRQVVAREGGAYGDARIVFADRVQTSNMSLEKVQAIFASRGVVLIDNSVLGSGRFQVVEEIVREARL